MNKDKLYKIRDYAIDLKKIKCISLKNSSRISCLIIEFLNGDELTLWNADTLDYTILQRKIKEVSYE